MNRSVFPVSQFGIRGVPSQVMLFMVRRGIQRERKGIPHRCLQRRGATLLDVALGSMLLSLLLIPAVKLIGESRSSRARLQLRDTILFEAENLVERTKISHSESSVFDAAYRSGSDTQAILRPANSPPLRQRVRVSADQTIKNEPLVEILVDVWQDVNGNRRMDAEEPAESLRTQWSAP
jgi:hypothetical protein